MYSSLHLAKKYVQYYLTARNGKGHGMHSPFVFGFILNVLNNKQGYEMPSEVEALRQQLLINERPLEIKDFGAGSRTAASKQRSVKQIAASALKPKKYAQVLYRLARYYQPKNILELGTSLGITTSYLSKAVPGAIITTIEGSTAIAAIAQKNFELLDLKNIHLLTGNFDSVLPSVLNTPIPGLRLL